jgi:hypothetical protein
VTLALPRRAPRKPPARRARRDLRNGMSRLVSRPSAGNRRQRSTQARESPVRAEPGLPAVGDRRTDRRRDHAVHTGGRHLHNLLRLRHSGRVRRGATRDGPASGQANHFYVISRLETPSADGARGRHDGQATRDVTEEGAGPPVNLRCPDRWCFAVTGVAGGQLRARPGAGKQIPMDKFLAGRPRPKSRRSSARTCWRPGRIALSGTGRPPPRCGRGPVNTKSHRCGCVNPGRPG